MARIGVTVAALAAGALGACASTNPNLAADGLPVWVDQPCAGQPKDAICASAESSFAAADIEMAKTDAETIAKNKIVDQISARVERLTEMSQVAMKDLTSGQIVGERTLKDINQNYQRQTLNGLRYADYFYYPNRMSPSKIYVRAVVTVESNKFSQDIVNAMMAGAQAEKLELKHEEAQARLEAVRKQYLAEEAANSNP